MDTVIIHDGFQPINFDHTKITVAQKIQGESLFTSGLIYDVKEVRKSGFPTEIQARCTYQIGITMCLNSHRLVTSAQCQCNYGFTGQCKHSYALMLYLNK